MLLDFLTIGIWTGAGLLRKLPHRLLLRLSILAGLDNGLPELILLFEIFRNSATDQESMEMLVQEDSISPADIARAEDCLCFSKVNKDYDRVSPFNLINSLSGSSLYYGQNMNQFIMAGALKRTICSMDIDCQSRRSFSRKRVKGSS